MQRSVDDAMGDILPVILTTIRKMPKITVPEMTLIAETLSASIMSSNVQKEVLETIDAKVNQGSPGEKAGDRLSGVVAISAGLDGV